MICYKDKTFCGSKVHKPDCKRRMTDEELESAKRWWGDENPPICYGDFCTEDKHQ